MRVEKSGILFLHIGFTARLTPMCNMSRSLADFIRKSDRREGIGNCFRRMGIKSPEQNLFDEPMSKIRALTAP